MNEHTLMIMVDALRHDYINEKDTPFLYKLSSSGLHGSLIPSFGFEPDGAYLAGVDPDECDGGAQYWYKPDNQDFYFTKLFSLLYIIKSKWLRKNIRRTLRFIAQFAANDSMVKTMATTSNIPLSVLNKFSLSMRHLLTNDNFMDSDTIFDVLKRNNLNFYTHIHPEFKVHIHNVVDRYLNVAKSSNVFSFLFIGTLDGIGHKYGPTSNESKAALKMVDDGIKKIYQHSKSIHGSTNILVFGDHGMVDINKHIDLSDVIKQAELNPKQDLYFLDSTFARFWIKDENRKKRLITLLDNTPGGHVLTDEDKEKYNIQYKHNFFGDVIFAVENNALIEPSYYSEDGTPPVGMHGYLPGCRDNESAFVLYSEKIREARDMGRIDMRRIFPTVIDLLGLTTSTKIPHNLKSII